VAGIGVPQPRGCKTRGTRDATNGCLLRRVRATLILVEAMNAAPGPRPEAFCVVLVVACIVSRSRARWVVSHCWPSVALNGYPPHHAMCLLHLGVRLTAGIHLGRQLRNSRSVQDSVVSTHVSAPPTDPDAGTNCNLNVQGVLPHGSALPAIICTNHPSAACPHSALGFEMSSSNCKLLHLYRIVRS
jgi:hypothetical protein